MSTHVPTFLPFFSPALSTFALRLPDTRSPTPETHARAHRATNYSSLCFLSIFPCLGMATSFT